MTTNRRITLGVFDVGWGRMAFIRIAGVKALNVAEICTVPRFCCGPNLLRVYCSLQQAHRCYLPRLRYRVALFLWFLQSHPSVGLLTHLSSKCAFPNERANLPLAVFLWPFVIDGFLQLSHILSMSAKAPKLIYHVRSITSLNFSSLLRALPAPSICPIPSPCAPSFSFISPIFPVTRASKTLIFSSSFPNSPSRVTRFG